MLTASDLNPAATAEEIIADFWEQQPTLEDHEGGLGGGRVPVKLRDFANERVRGVLADREQIDAVLGTLLEGWDVYRLGTVERAVMRMGIWELKSTEVPHAVVINEAIDLVNWFSTPQSRTLVNGVLDRYAKSLG